MRRSASGYGQTTLSLVSRHSGKKVALYRRCHYRPISGLDHSKNSSRFDSAQPIPSPRGRYPDNDLSSTRPRPLHFPDPPKPDPPGTSLPVTTRIRYWYGIGKEYVSFYKDGLKNVWRNYKEVRNDIRPRINEQASSADNGGSTQEPPRLMSRREIQLYHRTNRDLRKLVPFTILLIICGEWTPFVVLAIGSSIVPGTCRIPRQTQSDRSSLIARYDRELKLRQDYVSRGVLPTTASNPDGSHNMSNLLESHLLAYRLGLTWLPQSLPLVGGLIWSLRTRRQLASRLRLHEEDTLLIGREGGFERLHPEEVLEHAYTAPTGTVVEALREARQVGGGSIEASEKTKELLVPILRARGKP